MRILHIGLSSNYGGIEGFVMTYFRELRKQGIVFDFLDTYGNGLACQDEIEKLGGRVFTVPDSRFHPLQAGKMISSIIRTNGYVCVHIHMLSAANLTSVIAARKAGIEPIVHSHNTSTKGFARKFLHGLNKVILSRLKAERLSCGILAGKWMYNKEFTVIPNAVDMNRFAFNAISRRIGREKLMVDNACKVVGFVGRLEQQKNPMFLPQLLAELVNYDQNVRMVIIGSGRMEQGLRGNFTALDLDKYVLFCGAVSGVETWMCSMDFLVMPSLYEGLPVVAVEAQANGVLCLISDNITKEVCESDRIRRLPLDNISMWIDEIINEKNVDRCQYSELLRKSKFNVEVSSKILVNIYKKMTEKKSFE